MFVDISNLIHKEGSFLLVVLQVKSEHSLFIIPKQNQTSIKPYLSAVIKNLVRCFCFHCCSMDNVINIFGCL